MKQHQGVWLPDHEQHMVEWMNKSGEVVDGRGTYQIKKLREAMKYVKQFRVAIDVGAHVGFWSMHLVKLFNSVIAFEPIHEHADCYEKNLAGYHLRYTLIQCALGESARRVCLETPPGSSGGTHIVGDGDIDMRALDEFDLDDVDFIKIDCEGWELDVLKGARETILRCKPCIIVEQKQHIMRANYGETGQPALGYLYDLGAVQRRVMSGDYIFTF